MQKTVNFHCTIAFLLVYILYIRIKEKNIYIRGSFTTPPYDCCFRVTTGPKEIMETFGLFEGKEIGKIKHAIEEAILNGDIENEYDSAREYMLKIKDEILTD